MYTFSYAEPKCGGVSAPAGAGGTVLKPPHIWVPPSRSISKASLRAFISSTMLMRRISCLNWFWLRGVLGRPSPVDQSHSFGGRSLVMNTTMGAQSL